MLHAYTYCSTYRTFKGICHRPPNRYIQLVVMDAAFSWQRSTQSCWHERFSVVHVLDLALFDTTEVYPAWLGVSTPLAFIGEWYCLVLPPGPR